MNKQIRTVGGYEIVLYNHLDERIKEVVTSSSLQWAQTAADELLTTTPNAESYTISRILHNTKFNNWMLKQPY